MSLCVYVYVLFSFFELPLSSLSLFLFPSSSSLSFSNNPQITSSRSPRAFVSVSPFISDTPSRFNQSRCVLCYRDERCSTNEECRRDRGRASGSACRGFGGGHRRRLKSNRLEPRRAPSSRLPRSKYRKRKRKNKSDKRESDLC